MIKEIGTKGKRFKRAGMVASFFGAVVFSLICFSDSVYAAGTKVEPVRLEEFIVSLLVSGLICIGGYKLLLALKDMKVAQLFVIIIAAGFVYMFLKNPKMLFGIVEYVFGLLTGS